MRDYLLPIVLATLSLLFAVSVQAQSKPADGNQGLGQVSPEAVALLEDIEHASKALKTLKARVKYARTQNLTRDEQIRFGDFYYQAPHGDTPTKFAVLFDRLRLNEKKDTRQIQVWYIFDGNWLLERDHEDKQATRRELVPEGTGGESMLPLGDGGVLIPLRPKADQILKSYHVALPKLEDADPKLHHLRLTPRDARDEQAPLDLWFNKQTLLLYRVETKINGDPVVLNLPTPKPNDNIPLGVFATDLPDPKKGWQVQEVPLKR